MNKLTRKIKMKGYKIEEFLSIINISLSSYRKYEVENHPEHEWLCEQIDRREHKVNASLNLPHTMVELKAKYGDDCCDVTTNQAESNS